MKRLLFIVLTASVWSSFSRADIPEFGTFISIYSPYPSAIYSGCIPEPNLNSSGACAVAGWGHAISSNIIIGCSGSPNGNSGVSVGGRCRTSDYPDSCKNLPAGASHPNCDKEEPPYCEANQSPLLGQCVLHPDDPRHPDNQNPDPEPEPEPNPEPEPEPEPEPNPEPEPEPNPNPEPEPNPNPRPNPEPPPRPNPPPPYTYTPPSGGNTTVNIDLSPLINRQDITNNYLDAIEFAIRAQAEDDKRHAAELKSELSAINDTLKEHAGDNKDGLKAINDSLAELTTSVGDINTGLSGISDALGDFKEGFGSASDGEDAASQIEFPDYEAALDDAYNQIWGAINSDENNNIKDDLTNIGKHLKSFDSIPQIFALASEECSGISFGGRTLNLCSHASTVSGVLSWALTIVTMIFLVSSLSGDIKKLRMS